MITPAIGAIAQPENDPDSLRKLLERYLDDPGRAERESAAAGPTGSAPTRRPSWRS